MYPNPYKEQLEQQVLSADPVELVTMMLEHLIQAIADARRHLLSGDRAARARSISKGFGLLGELAQSLDEQQGGQVAQNLRRIYGFVASRLAYAQSHQIEQPLIEATQALQPLHDAWKALCCTRTEACGALLVAANGGGQGKLALRA